MPSLSVSIKKKVIARANHICEYCGSLASYSVQPFVIEHIIPLSKNGTDDLENLAYACGGCNGCKYNKLSAIDPISNENVSIYNPRIMSWHDHFTWSDDFLDMIGVSPIGRATVIALQTNRHGAKNLRKLLITINLHPPF